jgi:hypothetical protein
VTFRAGVVAWFRPLKLVVENVLPGLGQFTLLLSGLR